MLHDFAAFLIAYWGIATYISVDIEASGPIPGEYSMLSLGACVVGRVDAAFYVELKPISAQADEEALRVSGFTLADLEKRGTDPAEAMAAFESWLAEVTAQPGSPMFVAYPIAFDWMFVSYYFHRFLKRNPFGVGGLDLGSFHAALQGSQHPLDVHAIDRLFTARLTHNALDDARAQALVFERLLTALGRSLPR